MYESDKPEQYYLLSEKQQEQLCNWIKENFIPIKTINKPFDSYYLHGIFENDGGFYINNGMFKQAMKLCGFKIEDESCQNWKFNISSKSRAVSIRRAYKN